MEKLSQNWVTEGLIDFEYKKYLLLAYLQQVKDNFQSNKLYPPLSELVTHYNNLLSIRDSREQMEAHFPKSLSSIDLEKFKLSYRKVVEDDELMEEVGRVVHYAIPKIKHLLKEGRGIYEFMEEQLELDEIGIRPIYDKEGYLMLRNPNQNDLLVYQFQVSLLQHADENYRMVKTTFSSKESKSLARTVEQIKLDLCKRFKELPNPATFLISSKLHLPLRESFLPIAKRMLIRNIEFQA